MKKILIVGNMKATPANVKNIETYFIQLSKKKYDKFPHFYLAVPFPFIQTAIFHAGKYASIGAQTVSHVEEGAHTGEVTAAMLKSIGTSFVIIGHSEVRRNGDTAELVQQKAAIVVAKKMNAIICVGEEERDKDGRYLEYIEEQVKHALANIHKDDMKRVIIAYEPLWAIGSDRGATEEECFEVIISIRRTLISLLGIESAKKILVLYGGAVTEDNAESFLTKGGADGLLVGRASWKPETFISLIEKAHGLFR